MKIYGLNPTYHRGYKWTRVIAYRYLVPVLCAIAIGLGGCFAPAPDDRSHLPCDKGDPRPELHCDAAPDADVCVEPANEEGPPCSCFADYFLKTRKRPWCTALDWLVVLPAALFILGAGAGGAAPGS